LTKWITNLPEPFGQPHLAFNFQFQSQRFLFTRSIMNSSNKTRYSDEELQDFRKVILEKLENARAEFRYHQEQLMHANENGTDDTSNSYVTLEEGSLTLEKEQHSQQAARQRKFIDHLENALIRIENKTYGICRETGKLIQKERLMAVPHATLSMEAKLKQ
jgi:RNA polymerase-binding protein DksA